jgi:hypothetical protein
MTERAFPKLLWMLFSRLRIVPSFCIFKCDLIVSNTTIATKVFDGDLEDLPLEGSILLVVRDSLIMQNGKRTISSEFSREVSKRSRGVGNQSVIINLLKKSVCVKAISKINVIVMMEGMKLKSGTHLNNSVVWFSF